VHLSCHSFGGASAPWRRGGFSVSGGRKEARHEQIWVLSRVEVISELSRQQRAIKGYDEANSSGSCDGQDLAIITV